MVLPRNFSTLLQGFQMDLIELIQHGRGLVGGPDIEGRRIFRRTAIAVGGPERMFHAFVEEIAERALHPLDHFPSP